MHEDTLKQVLLCALQSRVRFSLAWLIFSSTDSAPLFGPCNDVCTGRTAADNLRRWGCYLWLYSRLLLAMSLKSLRSYQATHSWVTPPWH